MTHHNSRRNFILQSAAATAYFGLGLPHANAAEPGDTFPNRTITIVSGFAAGGSNDFICRAVARGLERELRGSVIVENKTGANGMIAAEYVARARGDGYTLFMAQGATHGANPSLYPDMRYDALRDFSPIGWASASPIVICVNANHPAKNFKELLAWARTAQNVTYGTSGLGGTGHFTGAYVANHLKLDWVHVPFKGDAPAITDLLGEQIQVGFFGATSAIAHFKSGKLRPIAISMRKRFPALQEVPTFPESGLDGPEFVVWNGLVATGGTPPSVIAKLNKALNATLATKEFNDLLVSQVAVSVSSTPEVFQEHIREELAKYKRITAELGIKL